ncbi:variable large family protein [Borreliella valaisiana]|uniref:variable large family protein n=1 Tax=Borreliella valaisiana TaxID=62088 RepID=UPI003B21908D
MKKMSSAILLGAMLVFANCKTNGVEAGQDDSASKFYKSLIQLGNGFLDVFTSFGGLVADALGFKADPKKSDVKTYFDSLAKKLEETKDGLTKLSKGNDSTAGDAGKAAADVAAADGAAKGGVEGAITEISKWLEEMAKAAKEAAGAATGSGDNKIGDVVKGDAGAAKGGDAESVNGIASGIKGIVDAAEKADAKEGKLDAVGAAAGEANTDAGKLFAMKAGNDGGGGEAGDAGKAAAAVAAVSGEQILKAIVGAAKKGDAKGGEKAEDAANPIEAAIGKAGAAAAAFAKDGMKKDDQIAAAMVLRGMAKGGQFALKDNAAHDAHKGTVKNAVESATNKTVVALTNLVRKAVQAGLKKVGDVVKGAVLKEAPASSATK